MVDRCGNNSNNNRRGGGDNNGVSICIYDDCFNCRYDEWCDLKITTHQNNEKTVSSRCRCTTSKLN